GHRSGPHRREVSVGGSLLQALLASRNLLLAIKDLDGRYVEVNAAYARALGLDAAAIRGRLDRDLLPPDVAGDLAQRERLAMRGVMLKPERESFDREAPSFLVERIPIRNEDDEMCAICLLAMESPLAEETAGTLSTAGTFSGAQDEVVSPMPLPEPDVATSLAMAASAVPNVDEVEIPLAAEGLVLVAMASSAEREALGLALAGGGYGVAMAATASEILLHLAAPEPGSTPPEAIFVDELLVRDEGKRRALLAALEALSGGLGIVIPVVAPGERFECWRTATGATQVPLAKGAPLSRLHAAMLALRASRVPQGAGGAALGGGVWLSEPAAVSQLEWDAALYSSLLARFSQRCEDFRRRSAEMVAQGELARVEHELGQLSRGARNLGAVPLASLAARLIGVLKSAKGEKFSSTLAELNRALDATVLAISARVQATSNPFEWADLSELAMATSRARECSAA
ncbi:MAG: PAS domain-containing protein, partial [Thermoanaerobaculia bacterium]